MRSKITVLLIVATLGIHCASTDPMRPWKGATLDQFIAAAGAPTADKRLSDGARIVEYLEEGRRLPGDVRKEEWVNCTLRINAKSFIATSNRPIFSSTPTGMRSWLISILPWSLRRRARNTAIQVVPPTTWHRSSLGVLSVRRVISMPWAVLPTNS